MTSTPHRPCMFLLDGGRQCPNPAIGESDFCVQHGSWFTADLQVHRAVTEHFRQDVAQLWMRSNFYLLVHAGLLSIFITTTNNTQILGRPTHIILGLLGVTFAIVWFVVARGSVLWLERWWKEVVKMDEVIDRYHCYKDVDDFAVTQPYWNPSYPMQYLPVIFAAAWIALTMLAIFSLT
jgi:hypothetical protein